MVKWVGVALGVVGAIALVVALVRWNAQRVDHDRAKAATAAADRMLADDLNGVATEVRIVDETTVEPGSACAAGDIPRLGPDLTGRSREAQNVVMASVVAALVQRGWRYGAEGATVAVDGQTTLRKAIAGYDATAVVSVAHDADTGGSAVSVRARLLAPAC